MFGPHVMIATGNHRTDIIGKYMIDIHDKREQDDQDVIIEDDVWIGMGSIILKGVKIGRGSVIGAGSIVTRDVPPYTIQAGSSEIRSHARFNANEIFLHEKELGAQIMPELAESY